MAGCTGYWSGPFYGKETIFEEHKKGTEIVLILRRGATKEEMATLEEKLKKRSKKKGVGTRKFCGILQLKEDPLEIQRKMRNEWE